MTIGSREIAPWVPFDLYDFFGYLFPGLFLLIALSIFMPIASPVKWEGMINVINGNVSGLIKAYYIVSFIVLVYVAGHAIATLSSICMDSIIMKGVIGYPVYSLLRFNIFEEEEMDQNGKPKQLKEKGPVGSTYKYGYLLLHVFLLVSLCIAGNWFVQGIGYVVGSLTVILLLILLSMHVFAPIKRSVHSTTFLYNINKRILKHIIDPGINILRGWVSVDDSFPADFREKYITRYKNAFLDMDPLIAGCENYWLPYFWVCANDESIARKIQSWVHLYGFARNMATTCYIMAVIIAIWIYTNPTLANQKAYFQLLIALCMGLIFFAQYWRLYHKYHTKNIIRSFMTIDKVVGEKKDQ